MAIEFNNVRREVMLAVALHWHDEIAPRHFEVSATARYGYKKRSRRYTRRKQKRFGHRRPLEYTGESKDRILNPTAVIVKQTKTGQTRLRINATSRFFRFRKDLSQSNRANELTTVNDEDVAELAEVAIKKWKEKVDETDEKLVIRS
ncbi:MAG: hypothetical protein ACYTEQ_01390 [Planctomycetota bacterium]